jgi:NAD(P)-dependent dehydrogenase (short-subunit alcohol dehydrogenase family)
MSDSVGAGQPKSALVFGARNLGRAVVEELLREGWQVAAAARSDATLQAVRGVGALPVRADVTDASSVEAALR